MNIKPYNLIIGIDSGFIQPACVMLASIFYYSKSHYHIHILTNLRESELNQITRFIKRSGNISVIYSINEDKFKGLKISDHVTFATYYRFLIPEIIPDVATGLYLDSDLIALEDLEYLFKTDLRGKIAGAVYTGMEPGFNAGVLLINFHSWRANNITEKLLSWANQHIENTIFWDQDALNAVLEGQVLNIDKKWNQTGDFSANGILHFAGKHKPWSIHYDHLQKKYLFYKFLRKTPYIRYHLPAYLKTRIKFLLWGKKSA